MRSSSAKVESYVTAPVEQGDLRETVTATGTLSPLDAVEVGAEVTGRVLKVHVDVNDRVKEGQILVEIDQEQLSVFTEFGFKLASELEDYAGLGDARSAYAKPSIADAHETAASG